MPDIKSREIRLKNRPVGLPSDSDFELAEITLPEVGEGEMLVRNIYMSVDPYMRGRMYARESYVPPFQIISRWKAAALAKSLIQKKTNTTPATMCSACRDGASTLFPTEKGSQRSILISHPFRPFSGPSVCRDLPLISVCLRSENPRKARRYLLPQLQGLWGPLFAKSQN